MVLTIVLVLLTLLPFAKSAPISLGLFRTRQHGLRGNVTLRSESVIEITVRNSLHTMTELIHYTDTLHFLLQGLFYDGAAPAAYFWIDTKTPPSSSGSRLLDASPTQFCGQRALVRATGETYVVEFPQGKSVKDYLGGCEYI
jgi:hypothetical protein